MAALTCHPDAPCAAVQSLDAQADVGKGLLTVVFRLRGDLAALRIPGLGPIARADRLWEHTCFEAFLQPEGAPGYVELNLAPSGAWAAYGFDGYRSGMQALDVDPPDLRLKMGTDSVMLQARIHLAALPGLAAARALRIGLCAVVEDAEGRRSYWALAHAPGAPDFHGAEVFALAMDMEGAP